MDGIASASAISDSAGAGDTVSLALLKKTQDMMSQQASALLATLPPPSSPSPNPPGVGGRIDILA